MNLKLRVMIPKLPACLTAALVVAPVACAADPLPALTIELARTSVSGLSSGAYMAGQFHLAFSSTLVGAGIIAGGPYGCAQGQLVLALTRCMQTNQRPPDPAALLDDAQSSPPRAPSIRSRTSPTTGSTSSPAPPTGPCCRRWRRACRSSTRWPASRPRTSATTTPCPRATASSPRTARCPAPGRRRPTSTTATSTRPAIVLEQIYGALNPRGRGGRATRSIRPDRLLGRGRGQQLAATGRVYVPASCAEGATCRVHVAFHGCQQSEALVGDAFTVGTGFNRWAETNGIVVLYPQAQDGPGNPNGCWDWWGYTDRATRPGTASSWQPFTGCCWRWRVRLAVAPAPRSAPATRPGTPRTWCWPRRGVRPRLCLRCWLGRRARPLVRRQHRL